MKIHSFEIKKLSVLIVINIFLAVIASSQTDTLYIDESEKVVQKKDMFKKRVIQFEPKNNLFHVTEYYFNGMLHLDGYSNSADGNSLKGKVERHELLSKLKHISYYNSANDYYTVYYNVSGDSIAKMHFNDCNPVNGMRPTKHIFEGFLEAYHEGNRIGFFSYFDNGKIASKYIVDTSKTKNPEYPLLGEQYDYEGKLLSKFKATPTGSVFEGKVYVYSGSDKNFTKTYKRTKRDLIEIKTYKNKSPTMIYYLDTYGKITDSLILSQNFPYDGIYKKDNLISFYKNGIEIGPRKLINRDGQTIIQIDFLEGQMSESKIFNSKGNIDNLLKFKQNKPWNGTGYYNNQIVQYKDGKKFGYEIQFKDNYLEDTLSIVQYENEIKSGGEKFFPTKNNSNVVYGFNKNGNPINGSFHIKGGLIKTFQDGTVNKEVKYSSVGDSFYYYFVLDYLADTCMSRLLDSNRILHCTYKDRKPYSGELFIKDNYYPYKDGKLHGVHTIYNFGNPMQSYTYVNGKKDGVYTSYNSKGIVQYTGIYREDQPYEGMIPYNNYLTLFKNGKPVNELIDGVKYGSIRWDGYAKYRYRNKIKEGESLFFFNSITADTTFFSGVFQNDKPYEGTFLLQNDIGLLSKVSYKNGKKHGSEIIYGKSSIDPITIENTYREGVLHGKSILKRNEIILEGDYSEGKIVRGHQVNYFTDRYFNTTYYIDSINRHRGYVYDNENSYLAGNNDGIRDGYIFRDNKVCVYKDYNLTTVTFIDINRDPNNKYDSLYTRTFSKEGFVTRGYNGTIIEKGTFLANNTTEVVYYSDNNDEKNKLTFKDELIISGSAKIEGSIRPSLNISEINYQAKENKTIVTLVLIKDELKIEIHLPNYYKFSNYDLLLSWQDLIEEAVLTNYIDIKTGRKVGSYVVKNYEKNGIHIVKEEHFFNVIKYKKNKIITQKTSTKGNLCKDIKSM